MPRKVVLHDASITVVEPTAMHGAAPGGMFLLAQNAPNPMRGATTIEFALTRAGRASVGVYGVSGRLIAQLYDGLATAGVHELWWDGSTLAGTAAPAGVYFYRLESEEGTLTRRLARTR